MGKTKKSKAPKPPKRVRTRSAISKSNRKGGHDFERAIVNLYKNVFGDYSWSEDIRRSDQSHRPWLPDVVGVPFLWSECLRAKNALQPAAPEKKLAQAIRDSTKFRERSGEFMMPVAIYRRTRGPMSSALAMLRASDLFLLTHGPEHFEDDHGRAAQVHVSMPLMAFLSLYEISLDAMTTCFGAIAGQSATAQAEHALSGEHKQNMTRVLNQTFHPPPEEQKEREEEAHAAPPPPPPEKKKLPPLPPPKG